MISECKRLSNRDLNRSNRDAKLAKRKWVLSLNFIFNIYLNNIIKLQPSFAIITTVTITATCILQAFFKQIAIYQYKKF